MAYVCWQIAGFVVPLHAVSFAGGQDGFEKSHAGGAVGSERGRRSGGVGGRAPWWNKPEALRQGQHLRTESKPSPKIETESLGWGCKRPGLAQASGLLGHRAIGACHVSDPALFSLWVHVEGPSPICFNRDLRGF